MASEFTWFTLVLAWTCVPHQSFPQTDETSLLPPEAEEVLPFLQEEEEELLLLLPHDEDPLLGVLPHDDEEYDELRPTPPP